MTISIPPSAEKAAPRPPGRRYWKVTHALILLHTLLDGTAFSLGFTLSFWDWILGTESWFQLRKLPLSYIIFSLVAWFAPLLMTVSNGFALYIVSKRSKGQIRPRTTLAYLLAATTLVFTYLASFWSTFRGQNIPFLGPALWLAAPAFLVLTGIILFRIPHARLGHCPRCDYNLTGNTSGTCPECGNPIAAAQEVRS